MKEKIAKLVELGFNYNKIAKLSGVPVTSLSEWCKGQRATITETNIRKLERWLQELKEQIANI